MTSITHIFTFISLLGLIHTQDSFIRVFLAKYPYTTITESHFLNYKENPDSIKDPSIPDTHYIAQLGIGSEDQKFSLALQTSLNYLVVGGPDSIFNNKFDCMDSSTCHLSFDNVTTLEGSTYCANGSVAFDQLILDSQIILNQAIFVINSSEGLQSTLFDGILGLGFDYEAGAYRVHILDSLRENNLISNQSFSIFLGVTNGQRAGCLILGGYDSRFNSTEFKYMNLTREDAWTVRLLNGSIGNQDLEVPENAEIYFESGTIGLLFPKNTMDKFKQAIEDVVDCSFAPSKMICTCDNTGPFPNVNLTLEGTEISLGPEDYLVHEGSTCSIYVGTTNDNTTFILGDVFMKKYYTHYDSDNKRIGLAVADQSAYQSITAEFSSLFYVIIFLAGCAVLGLIGYLAYLKAISKDTARSAQVYLTQETKMEEPVAQPDV